MSFDYAPGEEEVLRANLRKDKWMRHRCVTCSLRFLSSVYFAPILVPLYSCLGRICRKEEADSFELVLTNKNIYCKQKLYSWGMCCQTSGSITIPLEKIQDVQLISDWVGDSCGIVDQKGDVYQLHVQTAAMGGMVPELVVFCLENPREFKKKIMEARNALKSGGSNGQSKQGDVPSALANVNQEDLARILSLLGRQTDATVHSEPAQQQH